MASLLSSEPAASLSFLRMLNSSTAYVELEPSSAGAAAPAPADAASVFSPGARIHLRGRSQSSRRGG